MNIVCLDLEGVLVPEIWVEFAKETGIEQFTRTTRDEPDYDKLMRYRLDLLDEHGLDLKKIQETIEKMSPLEGAREFLDALREQTQVIIVSDTFSQFAQPLMRKLGWPTILCNELVVDSSGRITGWAMRKAETKQEVIGHLHAIGYNIIASGDSFNDLGMIKAASHGFLFKTTEELKEAHPDVAALDTYDELYAAIVAALD